MKHCSTLLIVAIISAASTGCTMLESTQTAMKESTKMFRPKPLDGPMQMDNKEDDWGFVGDEGRADREREVERDRWWHNLVMSQEARNIERNLGFD